eukprot:8851177-Lingulodinium_polyedra.AAC.1
MEQPGKGVKHEDDEVKALRAKCKTTLWVACAILSRDGLQQLVRLVCYLSEPIRNAHQEHTARVRGPDDVFSYYLQATKGSWQLVLQQICALLSDLQGLDVVGFNTEFRYLKAASEANDRILADDD